MIGGCFYLLTQIIAMTKTQLIAAIADQLGVSKRLAGDFVNTFASLVISGVKKE